MSNEPLQAEKLKETLDNHPKLAEIFKSASPFIFLVSHKIDILEFCRLAEIDNDLAIEFVFNEIEPKFTNIKQKEK